MVMTIPFNHATKESNIFFIGSLDKNSDCTSTIVLMGRGTKTYFFYPFRETICKTDYKHEIYAKNWVRRTWIENVNPRKKSIVKVNCRSKSMVNGQKSTASRMTWH